MIKIKVTNLYKSFKKYNSESDKLYSLFYNNKNYSSKIVLNNINFSIAKNESVGIIGKNGAGKSTLLKILAGLIEPENGIVEINGKLNSVLELGVGFNLEYSGRENAFMACTAMGIDASKIQNYIDDIYNFSELKEYFEEPIKIYSTGMQMRLAFSILVFGYQDIILIDEALSVGDTSFQIKSINKIKELKKNGSTLIFVSHDSNLLLNMCDRVILINDGCIQIDGNAKDVLNYYNASLNTNQEINPLFKDDVNNIQILSLNNHFKISKFNLQNFDGIHCENVFYVCDKLKLTYNFETTLLNENYNFGFLIKDKYGNQIFGTNSDFLLNESVKLVNNKYSIEFIFYANLGVGIYTITIGVLTRNLCHWHESAINFEIKNNSKPLFIGSSYIPVDFNILNNE